MTEETFLAICTEGGLTQEEAEVVWEARPTNFPLDSLTRDMVLARIQGMYPELLRIRRTGEMGD